MRQITSLTKSNSQALTFSMQDGREFDLLLSYRPFQIGWFLSITHEGKTINNIRITTTGNLLYAWRNIFQFGISCVVDGNQEPLFQDDFFSGRAKLYVLDRDETEDYSRLISGQISA